MQRRKDDGGDRERQVTYQHILYEVSEKIATITLNRPERMNAWTPIMERDVRHAMEAASADDNVRVIVLTGAEGAPRAGQHDDADIVVGARGLHGVAHVALHDRRPCVHALGPVQRDGRDLLAHLVEDMLIGHLSLPVSAVVFAALHC